MPRVPDVAVHRSDVESKIGPLPAEIGPPCPTERRRMVHVDLCRDGVFLPGRSAAA
eukprot:CAMPEP_0179097072 /NCGR_PEP_ID=MMETSP0796-20121207/44657_1 /TAXON_ID=73915 /ORGANISM="Pyrodinium bahamense, Strain pbaha01" /LENGTH=55 /DNA_ID=CAMNT_0020794803 /DNA_START=67 /DNA_END=230 /DNA_ORIENTATION=+